MKTIDKYGKNFTWWDNTNFMWFNLYIDIKCEVESKYSNNIYYNWENCSIDVPYQKIKAMLPKIYLR